MRRDVVSTRSELRPLKLIPLLIVRLCFQVFGLNFCFDSSTVEVVLRMTQCQLPAVAPVMKKENFE